MHAKCQNSQLISQGYQVRGDAVSHQTIQISSKSFVEKRGLSLYIELLFDVNYFESTERI